MISKILYLGLLENRPIIKVRFEAFDFKTLEYNTRGKTEEARVYKNLVSHYSNRIDSVNLKLC